MGQVETDFGQGKTIRTPTLKQLGVTDIVSVSAVGSLKEDLPPGKFVVVDQFIDRTFARNKTFFDDEIVEVCRILAKQKKRVIVAGLEKDYMAKAFGPMPELIIDAEYVTKNLAICVICGNPAGFTQRLSNTGDQILVGESEAYEARCRNCYEEPKE